ncbi:MAG: ABC transporter permease [Candidatus Dormibacteraeota bacterium]|nr:ABC transporter permease [Candidatus Dormibacteraeota bacterium]
MDPPRRGGWLPVWDRFRKDRLALCGGVFIVVLVLLALLAPLLPLRNPNHGYYELLPDNGQPLAPGSTFLLGSDANGRDLLSRIIWGSRVSLFIGFIANGLALVVGVVVGILAGYFGKWVDTILMRFTDVMMAFPVLLFSIALIAILQRSGNVLVIAAVIALFYWTAVARIVRAQVLSLREKEFIEAARSIGGRPTQILFRHILPHLAPILIVYGTIGIATSISTESILSFIGIGVQPPTADWGKMVSEGQGYFQVAPWLVLFPGLMILATVLAFNLVGDGLRDALDPRQRSLSRRVIGGILVGGQAVATRITSHPEVESA